MGYVIKDNRIVFKNNRAVMEEISEPERLNAVDTLIKLGVNPEAGNQILNEMRNLDSTKRQSFVSTMNVLSDSRPIVDAARRMAAYDTLCNELSQLNTMRGGVKGFKGFVGEHMQAANATANGRFTRVVNNNGPIDLIFEGKNAHKYPQQLKIGYKPGQIDFSKYKGQAVIVDKGNPYLRELQAEGARHGVKVIEGTVTEAEAKWWADAMQLESKITGNKTSYIVPRVQNVANNLSVMHEAGKQTGKSGALYGAGFSIGSNIVNMMRGKVTAGEAAVNVARDTAVSYGVGYATGAVGSAVARTAAPVVAVGAVVGGLFSLFFDD